MSVSACATVHDPSVDIAGQIPRAGGYEMVGEGVPADLSDAVHSRLRARGLTADGGAPAYVVQVARARRPIVSRIVIGAPAGDPDSRPRRRRGESASFEISISDRRTGAIEYRALAQMPVRRRAEPPWPALVALALPLDPAP